MPTQLARTKHYFLLNQEGQSVSSRDTPDFQDFSITLYKKAWSGALRAGCGHKLYGGWGGKSIWREHLHLFFFLSWVDGRNLSPEKLFLKPPDAFKIKNNGPHDKPSAAFPTKDMPDVFFSPNNSFHALVYYVKLRFLLPEQRHFLLDFAEASLWDQGVPSCWSHLKFQWNSMVCEKLCIF